MCLSDPSPVNSFHLLIRLRGSRGYVDISLVRPTRKPSRNGLRGSNLNREVSLLEDLLTTASGSWANCRQSDTIAQLFQCHESLTLAFCLAT